MKSSRKDRQQTVCDVESYKPQHKNMATNSRRVGVRAEVKATRVS